MTLVLEKVSVPDSPERVPKVCPSECNMNSAGSFWPCQRRACRSSKLKIDVGRGLRLVLEMGLGISPGYRAGYRIAPRDFKGPY